MNHTNGDQKLLPIILIDDDADDLEIMTGELGDMNCENEVFSFQLPAEALVFFKTMIRPPYLITCDVHMPKMDAYDLRTCMLEDLPHLSYVPFYVLSAVITEREMSFADTLQIHGFYIKGFSREVVQQNFRDMISGIETAA